VVVVVVVVVVVARTATTTKPAVRHYYTAITDNDGLLQMDFHQCILCRVSTTPGTLGNLLELKLIPEILEISGNLVDARGKFPLLALLTAR